MILGVAVLLDTFPVRLLLLPVFLRLGGQAAWLMPSWLNRTCPMSASGTATSETLPGAG